MDVVGRQLTVGKQLTNGQQSANNNTLIKDAFFIFHVGSLFFCCCWYTVDSLSQLDSQLSVGQKSADILVWELFSTLPNPVLDFKKAYCNG